MHSLAGRQSLFQLDVQRYMTRQTLLNQKLADRKKVGNLSVRLSALLYKNGVIEESGYAEGHCRSVE